MAERRGLARLLRPRRRPADTELAEELRFHVDMEAAALEKGGMPPEQARREARRRLGGMDRYVEELRDARGGGWRDALGQDLRFGVRLARRFPLFTAVVVLTIALGVGANTAIFSVVNAVLLRPLPFANGARLVSLWDSNPDGSIPRFGVSYPDFQDWSRRTRSFADMTLFGAGATTLVGPAGPENVGGLFVTPNFLRVLGVRPELGRDFGPDDEPGERSNSVIITHGYWQRRFGGDPSVLGRSVTVGGRPRTVIGVLPPSAALLGPALVGQPLDVVTVVEPSSYPAVKRHAQHLFGALATLRPGVTLNRARADLLAVETQVAAENPEIAGWKASVFYFSDDLSTGTRQPLLILLAASVLVLLIACINVANLLLVRGAARGREIAVRQALGASRRRLVLQLVAESVVLALAGAALGVAAAAAALAGIRRLVPDGLIPRVDDIRLDGRVLAFALGLGLATAVLFGLWPAIRTSTVALARALRDGGRGAGTGTRANRTRRVLVVSEISLALVLVVSAGLVMQSLARMLSVDPGFRPEHTVTAQVTLGRAYPDSSGVAFFRTVLADLSARPGIVAAGATDTPPLAGGGMFTSIHLVGQPPRPANDPLMSTIRAVSPGFFRAMGMRVMAGQDIEWSEARPTLILSETAARSFWPGESVVGKAIAFNVDTVGMRVVGEVNDARQASLATAPAPVVYVSLRRTVRVIRTMTIVARGRGDVATTVAGIRAAVRGVDPGMPIYNVQTMQSIVDQSVAQPRLNTVLLGVFAAAALLLAALGIYGVVSYSVAQRRQELGVRMALGARPGDVLRLVLGEGARLAAVGVAVGIVGALLATRLIASWLYDIRPTDPATFAAVAAGLVLVALAASWFPARRATRVDPLLAMRAE